jgi:uncharacterized protein YbjT (DUF2867 family)
MLLDRGESIRVVSRSAERLDALVRRGAEPAEAHLDDADALARAFEGAAAVFTLIPPDLSATDVLGFMDRVSRAEVEALRRAGVERVVCLSSIGAHRAEGTGHVVGHHRHEQRLQSLDDRQVVCLRPGYFMENLLFGLPSMLDRHEWGSPLRPDLPLHMVATRDIAAAAVEEALADARPPHRVRELLGERPVTLQEATRVVGEALDRPELTYEQTSYEETRDAIIEYRGASPDYATALVDMYRAYNEGRMEPSDARSPENTTPTSIESFVEDVIVPEARRHFGDA